MTVTAECGIRMSSLEDQIRDHGFEIQTVAVPRLQTTLGGVLSGVIGGGLSREAAIIGTNAQSILGLKVILPDGGVLDTNAGGSNVNRTRDVIADSDGPFITPLFLGDGGSFGVKAQATMRVTPIAVCLETGCWVFPNLDSVWDALSRLSRKYGPAYTTLRVAEAGGAWALTFTTRADDEGELAVRMRSAQAILQLASGQPAEAELRLAARAAAIDDYRGTPAIRTIDRLVVAFIFGNREFPGAFRRIQRFLADRLTAETLAYAGLDLVTAFRPHTRRATYATISMIYDDAMPSSELASLRKVAAGAYSLIGQLGGYSEAHQGWGSEILAKGWSPEYRRFVVGLKRLVDPNLILNPSLWSIEY